MRDGERNDSPFSVGVERVRSAPGAVRCGGSIGRHDDDNVTRSGASPGTGACTSPDTGAGASARTRTCACSVTGSRPDYRTDSLDIGA
jgi:hypothetical protein